MAIPKWLKEDLALTDAEVAVLDPVFTDTRATALDQGHLRQADYSRNMDQLKKDREALASAQSELATANERLNGEIAAWAETQAAGGQLTAKQQKALEDAEAKVTRLSQRVRTLATAAGQDPEKALEGIDVTPAAPVTPPPAAAPDMSGYLDRDAGARLAALSLALATTVPSIANEHFQLTGQTLDTEALGREIMARINTPGNKKATDVREVWIELHGITQKRADKIKADHDAEIAAAEKRGRDNALSEVNLPGPHSAPGRPGSPALARFTGAEHKSAVNRPSPGGTVQAAVSALRTGKYRTGAAAPAGK